MIPPPPIVLAFGEFLWDVFPEGETLGGAPANLAYHLCRLRCDARLISAVGEDDQGMMALVELRDKDVDVALVEIDEELPTGRVEIEIGDNGDATFEFVKEPAWERIPSSDEAEEVCEQARAFVFTSLALSSENNRSTLDTLSKALDPDALVVFDVNLRPPYSDRSEISARAQMAGLLKCNREEAIFLLGEEAGDLSAEDTLRALHDEFPAARILLTLDAEGAIYSDKENPEPIWARPVEMEEDIVDTVGAGDSFLACVVEGICRHREMDDILERAALLSSYVIRGVGAMPGYTDEMLEIAEG